MKLITGTELELLQKSKSYPFSKKDLPEQVFSKSFDRFIFIEDVHLFALEFFNQLKLFESKIGGNNIYLHSIEPYLPRDINYRNHYLTEIPPCFQLTCSENYTWIEIFETEIAPNQSYKYSIRILHTLFGDSGKWGYYNSRDDEIGIIGIEESAFGIFKDVVGYAFENCFKNFDEMLGFVEYLSTKEYFAKHKDTYITNYDGKDI